MTDPSLGTKSPPRSLGTKPDGTQAPQYLPDCSQRYEYLICHLPFGPTDPRNIQYLNAHGLLGWDIAGTSATEVRFRHGTKLESRLEQVVYFRRPLLLASAETLAAKPPNV